MNISDLAISDNEIDLANIHIGEHHRLQGEATQLYLTFLPWIV